MDDLEKNISKITGCYYSVQKQLWEPFVSWMEIEILDYSNFLFFQKKKKYNQMISKLKDRNTLISAKLEELTIERDYLK